MHCNQILHEALNELLLEQTDGKAKIAVKDVHEKNETLMHNFVIGYQLEKFVKEKYPQEF